MNQYMVAYLFNNVIVLFAIERFLGVFFEKRRTSLMVFVLSLLFYSFSTAVAHFLIAIPVVNVTIALFSGFIVVSLNYESFMLKRIATTVCIGIMFTSVNAIASLLFYGISASPFYTEYTQSPIVPYTATAAFLYLTALSLHRFKNIKKNIIIKKPIFWISTLLIPALSMVMVVVLTSIDTTNWLVLTFIIIIAAINILTFFHHDILSAAYEDKLKSALHTQERDYYLSQCQLMQESAEQIRSYRHDMNIHLAAIKGYSIDNKVVTDYLDNLLGSLEEGEAYSDTGNIAFDSIINFKLKNVKEQNIKLDLSLSIPSDIDIEVADIVTILGNLLDNALDAVAKIPKKMIKLDISFDRESLLIQIENTFDGVVKYAENTDGNEKRIITRKITDSDASILKTNPIGSLNSPWIHKHGHGLKNIQKSIKKYDGHIDIKHEGGIFSVGILLYTGNVRIHASK